jgi:hypothetical protein
MSAENSHDVSGAPRGGAGSVTTPRTGLDDARLAALKDQLLYAYPRVPV